MEGENFVLPFVHFSKPDTHFLPSHPPTVVILISVRVVFNVYIIITM